MNLHTHILKSGINLNVIKSDKPTNLNIVILAPRGGSIAFFKIHSRNRVW